MKTIDTLHIKYFLQLVQSGSITKASEAYFTSRQNFSKIIKGLETETGCTLFNRGRKGVSLTEDGKIFMEYAKTERKAYHDMKSALSVNAAHRSIEGTLVLYGGAIVLNYVLSEILPVFNEKYPNITLVVREGDPLLALEKIAEDPNGVGLLQMMTHPTFKDIYGPAMAYVEVTPLIKDDFVCLVGKNHPFAKADAVSVARFLEEPYADLFQNQMLMKALACYGQPKVKFSMKNMTLYFNAIATGKYVGLTSKSSMNHRVFNHTYQDLKIVPFKEDFSFNTSMVYQRVKHRSETVDSLVSYLIDKYRELK